MFGTWLSLIKDPGSIFWMMNFLYLVKVQCCIILVKRTTQTQYVSLKLSVDIIRYMDVFCSINHYIIRQFVID